MNLLLLPKLESQTVIQAGTVEYQHLTEVLRVQPGQLLETGVWNQRRGRSTVTEISAEQIVLSNEWFANGGHPGFPLTLVCACCRPIQAKRILREATALGVRKIVWVISDHTTRSYAQSSLWQSQNWLVEIQEGASHAFTNMGPEVIPPLPLSEYLESCAKPSIDSPREAGVVLDNYEAPLTLTQTCETLDLEHGIALWIGPERGWSTREREQFRQAGLSLAHLGCRVLKTEIACLAAIAQTIPFFPESYISHQQSELLVTGTSARTPTTKS